MNSIELSPADSLKTGTGSASETSAHFYAMKRLSAIADVTECCRRESFKTRCETYGGKGGAWERSKVDTVTVGYVTGLTVV
jgi:hypothetical protein